MSEQKSSDSTSPRLQPNPALESVASAFETAGLRYALIGGHGANAWGPLRGTDDFDFYVFPDGAAIARAELGLAAIGLAGVTRQDAYAASGPDFVRMANAANTIIVDIQTAKTDYQVGVIDRAVPAGLHRVAVARPEDLIIMKLLAMRPRDQRDIANLLNCQDLDWGYIDHWAAIWGTSEKLRVIVDERERTNRAPE